MKKSNPDQSSFFSPLFYRKSISTLLIVAIVATQMLQIRPVYGDPEKTRVNLVAILMEKSLDDSSVQYEGLRLFGPATLATRIQRYGLDIQNALPNTKAVIYLVEPNEEPYEITKVLEKLYFEGDGTADEINNLAGIVLVGNVPLPKVKKQEREYTSIFPYTDFYQKEFLYNPASRTFEETKDHQPDLQPEIWHGVIRPPVGGEEGQKLLAEYFDKNHAFYQKSAGYDDFEKKVFVADLPREGAQVQSNRLPAYDAFVAHWEDIAYLRFTKELAQELLQNTQESIGQNPDVSDLLSNSNGGDLIGQAPDIMTKQIVEKLWARYGQLVGNYPAQVQEWVNASGRWRNDDIAMLPDLISTKDEFSLRLLKSANDALETVTDGVAETMQLPVNIPLGEFLNGRRTDTMEQAQDCTIFRGSTVTVEANRAYNPSNEPNQCDGYAGCCAKNLTFTNNQTIQNNTCKPQNATKPVLDLGGTIPKNGDTSYRACWAKGEPVAGEGKEISSVIQHKEPTAATIQAQVKSKFSATLSIDNPRYVDFQNKAGEYERLDYVNFFALPIVATDTVEKATAAIEALLQTYETETNRKIYVANLKSFHAYVKMRSDDPAQVDRRFDEWEQRMLAALKNQSSVSYGVEETYRYFLDYYRLFQNGQGDAEDSLRQLTTEVLGNLNNTGVQNEDTLAAFIVNGGDTVTSPLPDGITTITRTFQASEFVEENKYQTALENTIPLATLADTLVWRGKSLQAKYLYALENYLSTPNTGEDGSYQDIYPKKSTGYESIYLRLSDTTSASVQGSGTSLPNGTNDGESSRNSTELNFSVTPGSTKNDAPFEDAVTAMNLQAAENSTQNALALTNQNSAAQLDNTCGSWDGVDLWQWFGAIQCWLRGILSAKETPVGDDDGDAVRFPITSQEGGNDSNENDPFSSPLPSGAGGNSSNPSEPPSGSSENPVLSAIELSASTIDLNLLDESPAIITIQLLDQNGKAYSSETNTVATFTLTSGNNAVALSDTSVPVQGSTAQVIVSPQAAGNAILQAKINGITSRPLVLRVYDRRLQVTLATNDNTNDSTLATSFVAGSAINAHIEVLSSLYENVPLSGTIQGKILPQNPDDPQEPLPFTGRLENGAATIPLPTLTRAGLFTIQAAVNGDASVAPTNTTLEIISGPAAKISLHSLSNVLVGNGITPVQLTVSDSYDNPAVGNYTVSLFINENGTIVDLSDANNVAEGTNVSLQNSAHLTFTLAAKNKGEINLRARVDGIAQDTGLQVQSLGNDGKVLLEPGTSTFTAGGEQTIPLSVKLVDSTGKIIAANQTVVLTTNTNTITLTPANVPLQNGQGTALLRTSQTTGSVTVQAEGLAGDPLQINVTSQPAIQLQITAGKNVLHADGSDSTKVYVSAVDRYGNVDTNFTHPINLALTDATKQFGSLSYTTVTPQNGTGDFTVTSTQTAGELHLVATAENITSGAGSLVSQQQADSTALKDLKLNGLYATILGTAAGNLQENYPAGWLLFNPGKTQAITTLIANPTGPKVSALITNQAPPQTSVSATGGLKSVVLPRANAPLEIDLLDRLTETAAAKISLRLPQESSQKLVADFSNTNEPGIYVQDTNLTDLFTIQTQPNNTTFLLDTQSLGNISSAGFLNVAPPLMAVLDESDTAYTINLLLQDEVVARVRYNVSNLSLKTSGANNTEPGIYIATQGNNTRLQLNGNTATLSQGNETVKIDEPFVSVEDSDAQAGVGWQGDFKNELLFAAGNTVGESTRFFASSLLINLGDPVVALTHDNPTTTSGYTQDIGQILANYPTPPDQLLPIDYNRNNQKDLLVLFHTGRVDLLQNFSNGQTMRSIGTLLQMNDGIREGQVADVNGDGWDDLVLVTQKGEPVWLQNIGGSFERQNLKLDLRGKVTSVVVRDMDADGKLDLVTAADSGDIKIFYGGETGWTGGSPYLVDTLGMRVSDINLQDETAVFFDGMPEKTENTADDYVELLTPTPVTNDVNNLPAEGGTVRSFLRLPLVTGLSSEKKVKDMNGGSLQEGDLLEYTIRITNNGAALKNLLLADFAPDMANVDTTSLQCDGCGDQSKFIPAGNDGYPILFGPIDVPQGQTMMLTYRATAVGLPQLALQTGDFDQGEDPYLDITARENSGNDNTVVLYHSTGARTYQRSLPDTQISTPHGVQEQYQDQNGNGIPDQMEKDSNGDGIPDIAQQALDKMAGDTDGDGIPDAWDDYVDTNANGSGNSLDDMVDSARASLNRLFSALCSDGGGGCVSLPLNYAFLAPGYQTLHIGPTSVKGPFVAGMPVFGLKTTPFFICSAADCFLPGTWQGAETPTLPQSVLSTSFMRFYVMPTLTGGLGTALCLGNYTTGVNWPAIPLTGNCFVTALPVVDLLSAGLCDQINASITSLISRAKSTILGTKGQGIFKVGYSTGRTSGGNNQILFNNGTFNVSVNTFKNKRPPSFPGFIMDWVDRQIEEITTKLTDLPTIYLLLPDFTGVFGKPDKETKFTIGLNKKQKEVKFIGDVIDYLNSLPFVNIHLQSVTIKYPFLSREQLDQTKAAWQIWLEETKEKIKNFPDSEANRLKVQGAKQLVARVESNLQRIQEYADFPKQIEQFAYWKTRLIKQVLVYLNKIADYTGGYYLRNKVRVVKWVELFLLVKEILKGWQLIPDVFLDYRQSCSTCRNDRGNSMDWQLRLFAMLIPDLPVIPFPKWPDIVIDTSNINAVIDIPLPTPKFVPQDIILPQPPNIDLATFGVNVNVDALIPRLPPLPSIPDLFPKLPQLPLPKLPDLPPPPKLPKLLGSFKTVLKVIDLALYVWCLYQKGIPLVKEWELKPTVEHMTERTGFLPSLDFAQLSFPVPRLPYIEQIRVETFVDFKLVNRVLYDFVRQIAERLNKTQTNFLRAPNVLPSEINTKDLLGSQDISPLEQALQELATVLETDKNELVTADEMKALLEQNLTDLQELSPSTNLQALRQTLQAALLPTTQSASDSPAVAKIIAMQKEVTSLLAQATQDEQRIATAVQHNENLLAVTELQHWFGQRENMLAASGNTPTSVEEKILTTASLSPILQEKENSAPKLLAQNNPAVPTTSDASNDPNQPSVQLDGIYLYNPTTRQPEKLVAYNYENGSPSALALSDVDGNGQDDVFYALGNTLYLKTNRLSPTEDGNHFTNSPAVLQLQDQRVEQASVDYFEAQASNGQVTLSWAPGLNQAVIGYQLTLKRVINRFDLEKFRSFDDKTTVVLLALPGQEKTVFAQTGNTADNLVYQTASLTDAQHPSLTLPLPNGYYYGKIASLSASGMGTLNEINLLAPQSYGDTTPPVAAVVDGNAHSVPILQSITLDASPSYSPTGAKIVSYFWDTKPDEDTNGDGLKTNDADYFHTLDGSESVMSDPKIILGPFTQPGEQRLILNVVDENGNVGQVEVVLQVYVPGLSVDHGSVQENIIQGSTKKSTANEPVTLIRIRDGLNKLLRTNEADANGQYKTKGDGTYEVKNWNTQPGIAVKDAAGKTVAIVSETSGRVTLQDPAYTLSVSPATTTSHTLINILKGTQTLSRVRVTTDPNQDVVLEQSLAISSEKPEAIHVLDVVPADTYQATALPGNAPSSPGSVVIYDRATQKLVAVVASNGAIRLLDTGLNLTLLPAAQEDDPVVFALRNGDTTLFEIHLPRTGHATIQ